MFNKYCDSIIDAEVIEAYEKETGKQWREDVEERMAKICSFFDYGFAWNKNGNIVINNFFYEGYFVDVDSTIYSFHGKNISEEINGHTLKHFEYASAEKMVAEWLMPCKAANAECAKNGEPKPFVWADESMEKAQTGQNDYSQFTTEELIKMEKSAYAEYYRLATTPCTNPSKTDLEPLERATATWEAISEELRTRKQPLNAQIQAATFRMTEVRPSHKSAEKEASPER